MKAYIGFRAVEPWSRTLAFAANTASVVRRFIINWHRNPSRVIIQNVICFVFKLVEIQLVNDFL